MDNSSLIPITSDFCPLFSIDGFSPILLTIFKEPAFKNVDFLHCLSSSWLDSFLFLWSRTLGF